MKYFVVLIASASIFFLTCDSTDCPVCPEPDPEPVDSIGNYDFYISDTGGDSVEYIYMYNTLAGEVTDSIRTEYWGYSHMAVSPNGRYLILSGGDTFIVDTESKGLVDRKYYGGGIIVSPSGNFVGILGNAVWMLDGNTFEEIYIDTVTAIARTFHRSEDILYTVFSDYRVSRHDLAGDTTLTDLKLNLPNYEGWTLVGFVTTDDPNKVYLTLWGGQYLFVIVSYDFETQEIGLNYAISTSGGLVLTPDGKTLVGASPSGVTGPPDPLNKHVIFFIDVQYDLVTDVLPPFYEDGYPITEPKSCSISPDGQVAVFSTVRGTGTAYSVIDVPKREYIGYDTVHFIDGEHTAMMVACQRDP